MGEKLIFGQHNVKFKTCCSHQQVFLCDPNGNKIQNNFFIPKIFPTFAYQFKKIKIMKNINILEANKPSKIHLQKVTKELLLYNDSVKEDAYTQPVDMYITSDEEIKEGDWYVSVDNFIRKADVIWDTIYGKCPNKKIILTTDKDLIRDGVQAIDDEFIEWFCENPSCEKVEIDKQDWFDAPNTITYYKIIIPKEEHKHAKVFSENGDELFFDEQGYLIKEEPKQETPEKIAERYYEDKVSINAFINGYKVAQEQFKNK